MKVVVLGGGTSLERAVSLRSAKAVANALREAGLHTNEFDPRDGHSILDVLDQDHIIFPILHGAGGEDGTIQAELEKRKLPYLGTDVSASAICFDKHLTRQVLKKAGLPIAVGEHVTLETYADSHLRHKRHVIKAVGGGSSIGTLIVHDPGTFDTSLLSQVFTVSDRAVIEEFVPGIEITVPILDATALPVIEIQPPKAGEFDYENKYNGKTRELCPPVSINKRLQQEAQAVAEAVHKTLGARHLSRVDMIVRPDGTMVVLEINTIPGMTDQSLYPKAAATHGIPFPQLMKEFVRLVRRDNKIET